jgi:hypothetical protein
MRANHRRPNPSLVAIALGLFATALAALAIAASGEVSSASSQHRADGDPSVAHALVVDRAPGDHAG